MKRPFDGNFAITQKFGNKLIINGVDIYAQWGYLGHNGIDYGTPSGTPILAPHSGKVIEAAFDQYGYGNYVKIENDVEGSVLAHFSKTLVSVGQEVKEGQQIALSGNTGNSTGPHLHWGYYRHPRNRANGYGGFIDQTPYLSVNEPTMNDLQEALNEYFNQEVSSDFVINFINELKAENTKKDKAITEKDSLISSLTQNLTDREGEYAGVIELYNQCQLDLGSKEDLRLKWLGEYRTQKKNFEDEKARSTNLLKQLTECKNKQELTVGELLVRLWNKLRGVKI